MLPAMNNNFIFIKPENTQKLPETAGVYCFRNAKEILYIGKANNLKKRIKNHFFQPSYKDNLFIKDTEKIGYLITDSEIEALILEAKLIKKHQPKYNTLWKDGKGYYYVVFSTEKFPRVFITHQPEQKILNPKHEILNKSKIPNSNNQKRVSDFEFRISDLNCIGPFTDSKALKITLRLLRRIFPYYTANPVKLAKARYQARKHSAKPCPDCHLGLCPGPNPDPKKYRQNIENLVAVLKGEKTSLLEKLKKQMFSASASQDFEKAAETRNQIFALEKVFAHKQTLFSPSNPLALIQPWQNYDDKWKKTRQELKKLLGLKNNVSRIEAYDISNIQGKESTGSMVVFTKGLPDKSSYRRFKIKISGKPNDTAMIKEVLERRFRHSEWPDPDIILIDGGKGQLNAAAAALKSQFPITNFQTNPKFPAYVKTSAGRQIQKRKILVISLAKKHNELFVEDRKKPILLKDLPQEISNLFLRLRDEAHRFARKYHLKLREKSFFRP